MKSESDNKPSAPAIEIAPETQFVSVRVPMQPQFIFPDKCVVCGKPSLPDRFFKVSLQKSDPNLFTPGGWYEIQFPVCAEDDALAQFSRKKSRAGCLPAGLFGVVIGVVVYLLTLNVLPALLACFLGIVLGWIFFSWISDKRIPTETMERYRKLMLAVKITALHPAPDEEDARVDIRFSSAEYARRFSSLNKGEIV